jgi:hypothetical protein
MDVLVPFGIFLFIGVFFYIIKKGVKDSEPLTDKLAAALAKENYTIISERPMTLWEDYQYHDPQNGGFIYRRSFDRLQYKSIKLRHFVVKNEKEHYFELFVRIFKTWDNEMTYEIVRKVRIRDL